MSLISLGNPFPNTRSLFTRQSDVKHRFSGIFTVSYGLDREKLEELNFMIRSSDPVECDPCPTRVSLSHLLVFQDLLV